MLDIVAKHTTPDVRPEAAVEIAIETVPVSDGHVVGMSGLVIGSRNVTAGDDESQFWVTGKIAVICLIGASRLAAEVD